jgi:hypothetical protein
MSLADEVSEKLEAANPPTMGMPLRRPVGQGGEDAESRLIRLELRVDAIAELLSRIAEEIDNLGERPGRL